MEARTAAAVSISPFCALRSYLLPLQGSGKFRAIGLGQRLDKFFITCSYRRDLQVPIRIVSINGKLHIISKTLQMILWELRKRKALLPVKSLTASASLATASGQTGTAETSQLEWLPSQIVTDAVFGFLRKINLHAYYFSWSQLINDRTENQNDIDVANWPASLENVNSITL